MKKLLLSLFAFFVLAVPIVNADSPAGTLYVRTDGGTPNGAGGTTVCNGQTDAPAAGNSPNCAFNHPNWAIPPQGQPTTWRVAPGSAVVIAGPQDGKGTGVYRMGCTGSANCLDVTVNMTDGTCAPSWSYDCGQIKVPNGISNAQRTTVKGCSLANGCGSNKYPELWEAGRMNNLFDIEGSTNITFSNLEVTDHAAQGIYDECTTGNTGLCGRQAFGGSNWTNITMEYLYIHGLTYQAMKIGGSGAANVNVNWRMERVRVSFNPMAGIDTDTCFNGGTCGFRGNITWKDNQFDWNGFVEPYPIVAANTPVLNSGRTGETGGYGDAYGGSDSGGTWNIDGLVCHNNSSDCVDLLYCGRTSHLNYGQCTVRVNRMTCEANAGNCVKGPTDTVITNSKLNGNCAWWSQHTNYYQPGSVMCRVGGFAAHPIAIDTSEQAWLATPQILNNTVLSNADGVINYGGACPTPAQFIMKNNIFVGGQDIGSGNVGEKPDLFYVSGRAVTNDGCPTGNITVISGNNICMGSTLKSIAYCNAPTDKNVDPQFTGTLMQGIAPFPGYYSGFNYNDLLTLKNTSPAIGMADTTVSYVNGLDFNGNSRGAVWDAGAEEFNGSSPATPSSNGATCTAGTQCSSNTCCFGICTATACETPPTTNTLNASWAGLFGR